MVFFSLRPRDVASASCRPGHRHLAALVAHALLDAEGAAGLEHEDGAAPAFEAAGALYSKPLAEIRDRHPKCLVGADLAAAVSSARGWAYEKARKYYAGDGRPNSTIAFVITCDFPCGVRVGITRSYQPLGLADVSVDGAFAARLDGHDAFWRRENLKWSIYSEQDVTPPLALPRGTHTVAVACAGASSCAAADCASNYRPNEFHVRNVVAFYSDDGADGPPPGAFMDELAAQKAEKLARMQRQARPPAR